MRSIFDKETVEHLQRRLDQLTPESQPKWGTMSVAQMMAHCSVAFEMVVPSKHPSPNFLMKFILKTFVKPSVLSDKPYPKNGRTAPAFIISDKRSFDTEKQTLLANIKTTQERGSSYFENKESVSFGTLRANEWSILFYKHLDHHLQQFGV